MGTKTSREIIKILYMISFHVSFFLPLTFLSFSDIYSILNPFVFSTPPSILILKTYVSNSKFH